MVLLNAIQSLTGDNQRSIWRNNALYNYRDHVALYLTGNDQISTVALIDIKPRIGSNFDFHCKYRRIHGISNAMCRKIAVTKSIKKSIFIHNALWSQRHEINLQSNDYHYHKLSQSILLFHTMIEYVIKLLFMCTYHFEDIFEWFWSLECINKFNNN